MTKITQLFTDSFRKLKEKVSSSSKKKDTKYGTYESHESTHEITSQTRESMVQTTQEIKTQLEKSSSKAKLNTQKALSKKDNSKSLPSLKKSKTLPSSKPKSVKSTKVSKPVKSQLKTTPKKTPVSKVKNDSKTTLKKQNEERKYPSGKIVNSVLLTEIERGYLELAGFKNYKDAFVGLETSTKRSSVAKQVATQSSTMTTILKKLELLQIKGVGENVAYVLVQVGTNSLQKLIKSDASKLIKKVQNYSKTHTDIDIKLSQKQLENIQREAKLVPTGFNN